jgi:hypothetical protein
MNVFSRLPHWLRGCLAGNALGSLLFFTFVALFSLTPLHLLVAVFAASGSSGGEMFGALALPAALLGAWVGGLFGMPIGALAGKAASTAGQPWSLPAWLTGAIVTAYVILPNFVDPTTKIASEPAAMRVLTFVILMALGALIGFVAGGIRRLVRKRT